MHSNLIFFFFKAASTNTHFAVRLQQNAKLRNEANNNRSRDRGQEAGDIQWMHRDVRESDFSESSAMYVFIFHVATTCGSAILH